MSERTEVSLNRRLIAARLMDRVEVKTEYKVHIKLKISLKRFFGQAQPDPGFSAGYAAPQFFCMLSGCENFFQIIPR
jgi:hypothetical protein